MPRFRLKADHTVDLYHPGSHAASLRVEPGQVVDAPGSLEKGPEDAYSVSLDDDTRLWPKSLWDLVQETKAVKPEKES